MKRVAVIGAGVSGLCTVKELLAEGHEVECFEASEGIGGAFAGKGVSANRSYESLYLTISNYYMAFSDFPPPRDDWKFWTGGEYLAYLEDYAAHFKLMPSISLGVRVTHVERDGDGWRVTVEDKSGQRRTSDYDALAVCCGTHQIPSQPKIKGLESFTGRVDHSSNFWDAAAYRDQRVVVVGLGESSADIVRDVSDVSASCDLVVRQYPFCLPRVMPGGHPADSMTSRLLYPSRDDSFWTWLLFFIWIGLVWMPLTVLGVVRRWTTWKASKDAFGQQLFRFMDVNTVRTSAVIGLMAKWHADSDVSFVNKYATKNGSWIPNILSGKISPHLGQIAHVAGSTVTLLDGTVLEEVDAILFCTGYKDDFSFLPPAAAPVDNDVRQLFLHAFVPQIGSSLAFVGFSRPTTGAIPACSELVARYFALLVSGKRHLPPDAQVQAASDAVYENEMMYNSLQVRSCVNPCEFMDKVARLIGCYRSHYVYALNPLKYLHWMSALNCAARFRLVGPHACPKVAQEWLDRIPITIPLGGMVALSLHKMFFCTGLAERDIMLSLRKRGVEATWVLNLG